MIELLTAGGSKPGYPGPGGKVILKGNDDAGWLGMVSAAQSFGTQDELIASLGMTNVGTKNVQPGAVYEYFKFVLKGKVLYMPKFPLKSGISWNTVYNNGLVYGKPGNGPFPTDTPADQGQKILTAPDGSKVIARLPRVFDQDPYQAGSTDKNSEFWQLLVHFTPSSTGNTELWGNYTVGQLGWSTTASTALNTHSIGTSNWAAYVYAGVTMSIPAKTLANLWWPVLELMT